MNSGGRAWDPHGDDRDHGFKSFEVCWVGSEQGSLLAAAMLAIIRSAMRPRGLRPALITSAAMTPYCRAASASNGRGLKVASTRCTRKIRWARSLAFVAAAQVPG
jgi:hypothetical protein